MPIPALLDALVRAHGPTGHEHLAFDVVREAVGDIAEIETDSVGNLVARRGGEGPLLALVAHLDVIGFAVAHIPDDALIAVHRLEARGRTSRTASASRSGPGTAPSQA